MSLLCAIEVQSVLNLAALASAVSAWCLCAVDVQTLLKLDALASVVSAWTQQEWDSASNINCTYFVPGYVNLIKTFICGSNK